MSEARGRTLRWPLAFLLGLLALQGLALAPARRLAARPPAWDQANHLEVALTYRDAVKAGRWRDIFFYRPNSSIPPFPPLYHLALAAVSGAREPAAAALWINWLYLCALALAVFAGALELGAGPWASAAAAVALAAAPAAQQLARSPLVDLPLAAAAAVSYWLLLRCDGFARRGASLAFGLSCAAGMLHKWSFFSYLLPAAVVWARALRRRETRANAAFAALLGVGLAAPWYLVRLPLVVVRLTQATNDFVVPFWRGGAFFSYLRMAPAELGWVSAAALAAALLWGFRSRRRALRLLAACFAAAYVFWALLPNRQFRYLFPAVPAAAMLAGAALPGPVMAGLAAWQGVGAARAWRRDAASPDEDWHVADVLAEIARRAPDAPMVPVAVIADAERFNKLDFIWYAHRAGERRLEFRGVHDVPWELSRFVVTKTGSLGPDAVTAPLRPAAAMIAEPGGWFAKAFAPAARWPLPDGSQAVLYERRLLSKPPMAGARFSGPMPMSSLLEFPRASLRLGAWDRSAGAYRTALLSASTARAAGLELSDVRAALRDAVFVPDGRGARLVSVGALTVLSASVTADALRARLERAGLRVSSVSLDGAIDVAGRLRGLPVSGAVDIQGGGGCRVTLERASVAGVPLPAAALRRWALNGPPLRLTASGGVTTLSTVFGLHRSVPFPVGLSCAARGGRLELAAPAAQSETR